MSQPTNDEIRRQLGPTGKERCRIGSLIAVGVLLFGCGYKEKMDTVAAIDAQRETIVTARVPGYAGDVVEVKLEDGTRCAVMLGHNKGGISCDWKGAK